MIKKIIIPIYYFLIIKFSLAQGFPYQGVEFGGRADDKNTGIEFGGRAAEDSVGKLPNPLKTENITDLINQVTTYLIMIAAPIVTIMVIVGAFQILTAGGNPEKFKKGKQTIFYAVIGFSIVLIAKGITALIKQLLGAK